jgi:phosphoglycolate phosphatase
MPVLAIGDAKVEASFVLFDLDGTLVDGAARHRSLARMRIEAIGNLAGPEAAGRWAELSGVDPASGDVDPDGPLARAPRREDLAVAAAAIYLTGRGWQEARRLAIEVYEEADRLQERDYTPVLLPGVGEALRRLREAGFRLGIATNGEGATAAAMAGALGIEGLFDAIVGAEDVKQAKPAPDMILLACERVGVTPGEAVYAGDLPEDVEAGRGAGVKAVVAVNSPDPSARDAADFALDTIADMRPACAQTRA